MTRHAQMVDAALWLAEQGFADIGWAPVTDGKAPKRKWKSDASSDLALIQTMLRPGRNALVIPKGKAAVIDTDDPAAAVALEAAGMPPGFRVQSPTPGHGHFYVYQNGTELPTSFAGGDIRRGGSGMVLGPWALRTDGIYTANDVRTLPELPPAVSALLVARRQAEREARTPEDPGWFVGEGERHTFLVARARHLRGVGLTGERLRDELRRLNAERCRPPKAEAEVDAIADWTGETITDDPPPAAVTIGHRTAADLAAGPPLPQLADPYLTPEGATVIYARGGTGKGLLACWLAQRLVRSGQVVMVLDFEGHEREWGSRLRGLGLTDDELAAIHYRAPFDAADWTAPTGALAAVAEAVREDVRRPDITYLIVDSYTTATTSGDTMGGQQAAQEYFGALARIGLRSLTIAHVRGDSARFPDRPFGSVFVHNLARETWAVERVGDDPDETEDPDEPAYGPNVIELELRNRKSNGRRASRAQYVTISIYADGTMDVSTERPTGRALADLAADALADGALTLPKLRSAIREDTGQAVDVDVLRVTLKRHPQRFMESNGSRPRTWAIR
jgi:hypothetical protein